MNEETADTASQEIPEISLPNNILSADQLFEAVQKQHQQQEQMQEHQLQEPNSNFMNLPPIPQDAVLNPTPDGDIFVIQRKIQWHCFWFNLSTILGRLQLLFVLFIGAIVYTAKVHIKVKAADPNIDNMPMLNAAFGFMVGAIFCSFALLIMEFFYTCILQIWLCPSGVTRFYYCTWNIFKFALSVILLTGLVFGFVVLQRSIHTIVMTALAAFISFYVSYQRVPVRETCFASSFVFTNTYSSTFYNCMVDPRSGTLLAEKEMIQPSFTVNRNQSTPYYLHESDQEESKTPRMVVKRYFFGWTWLFYVLASLVLVIVQIVAMSIP